MRPRETIRWSSLTVRIAIGSILLLQVIAIVFFVSWRPNRTGGRLYHRVRHLGLPLHDTGRLAGHRGRRPLDVGENPKAEVEFKGKEQRMTFLRALRPLVPHIVIIGSLWAFYAIVDGILNQPCPRCGFWIFLARTCPDCGRASYFGRHLSLRSHHAYVAHAETSTLPTRA